MGGNVETIKEQLDIVEVIAPYLKLDKAGANFKGRCPFHNEKTPSFFVSPVRQNYYCFGCGAKGDIFTFVEEMEGVEFRDALKMLADKAGVELVFEGGVSSKSKAEKDKLIALLEEATSFFERGLEDSKPAMKYLESRGVTPDSARVWRLGWAVDEWRLLSSHLKSLGFEESLVMKAGLAKFSEEKKTKEPYDVFRGRIIFPIADAGGRVVGFSGRALAPDTEPKYLNSPDGVLFNKSELLYGLDKAKESIRRKNYTVLVEGQMDLVLSHQAGVRNTVASSGTAFTAAHLTRLKKLSSRIILAFDGDDAGKKAVEKSALLALKLGMEVKVAQVPAGKDPADLAHHDPESWKQVLRESLPVVEHVLSEVLQEEKDYRKAARLVERRVLPLISLLESAMERSHFVSLVARKLSLKEEVVWEDLKRASLPPEDTREKAKSTPSSEEKALVPKLSRKDIEERLRVVSTFMSETGADSPDFADMEKEREELETKLAIERLQERRIEITAALAAAGGKDDETEMRLTKELDKILKEIGSLEEVKNMR